MFNCSNRFDVEIDDGERRHERHSEMDERITRSMLCNIRNNTYHLSVSHSGDWLRVSSIRSFPLENSIIAYLLMMFRVHFLLARHSNAAGRMGDVLAGEWNRILGTLHFRPNSYLRNACSSPLTILNFEDSLWFPPKFLQSSVKSVHSNLSSKVLSRQSQTGI